MSLLIQLRYRLKAIDTIKKITHAMRLISMSARTRLKSKEEPLKEYINTSLTLIAQLKEHTKDWHNPLVHPSDENGQELIILIGSSRGLCGNFNTSLFNYFDIQQPLANKGKKPMLIVVGKKAINYAQDHGWQPIIARYPDLHAKKISFIAHQILDIIVKNKPGFSKVTVYSNQLKTFFVQKPHQTQLIPLVSQEHTIDIKKIPDYYWEQSPQELLDQLAYQTLESEIHYLLFESLLAEHAARFISMDNATRNAQSLLEETQLHYNKLRQTKITKELTELVSSI